jgi:hypothetical protein
MGSLLSFESLSDCFEKRVEEEKSGRKVQTLKGKEARASCAEEG